MSQKSKWKAHQVEGNVEYTYDNKTMFPLRFKTVDGAGAMGETWTTFYYNDIGGELRWGQLRWSEKKWGVELYGCTDASLSTTKKGDKFTNVPKGPDRIWEISWDLETFNVKCNGVKVWTFQFSDHLPEFSDETCGQIYGELYGPLNTFVFNNYEVQFTGASGLNVPTEFYSDASTKGRRKDKNRANSKKKVNGNKGNKKNKGRRKKTKKRMGKAKKNKN